MRTDMTDPTLENCKWFFLVSELWMLWFLDGTVSVIRKFGQIYIISILVNENILYINFQNLNKKYKEIHNAFSKPKSFYIDCECYGIFKRSLWKSKNPPLSKFVHTNGCIPTDVYNNRLLPLPKCHQIKFHKRSYIWKFL